LIGQLCSNLGHRLCPRLLNSGLEGASRAPRTILNRFSAPDGLGTTVAMSDENNLANPHNSNLISNMENELK
jgi:hypothetical protein